MLFKQKPTCVHCGKSSRSLFLDSNGLCPACSDEYYRLRAQRAKLMESIKKKEALNRLESIPLHHISLSPEPRKRRRGYKEVPSSPIYRNVDYGNFVVFDTETTGFTPSKDRIVELGAVMFYSGYPIERFSTLINPECPIPSAATEVNHITDDMVMNAPTISMVLPAFEAFVGGYPLVAHNLEFDLKMLFYSGSIIFETNRKYYDTLALARQLLKRHRKIYHHNYVDVDDMNEDDYYSGAYDYDDYEYNDVENHKLGTLCDYYKIIHPGPHRADADALATGDLFLALVNDKLSR